MRRLCDVRLGAMVAVVGAALFAPAQIQASFVEYHDYAVFQVAAPYRHIIGFDDVPAGTVLTGTEYPGIIINGWPDTTVINPLGWVNGSELINSHPNGIGKDFYYENGIVKLEDDGETFEILFTQPTKAAGLWIGNVGMYAGDPWNSAWVKVYDDNDELIVSKRIHNGDPGMVGSGRNNRFFYGVTSDMFIGSIVVDSGEEDGDGLLLDDIQYGIDPPAQPSLTETPEPASLTLLLVGLAGIGVRRWIRRRV